MRGQASKERLYEADRLLTNLAEQRQMADDAVTAQILLRKQQLCDSRWCFSSMLELHNQMMFRCILLPLYAQLYVM